MRPALSQLLRIGALILLCGVALQLTFALRVAWMRIGDLESTAFQRSEAWRLMTVKGSLPWRHEWVDRARISTHLQRAILASEDSAFVEHTGFEWDSIEKAWSRNQRVEADQAARSRPGAPARQTARLVGGSTITQQLAKNLFLSGERTLVRKAQEFVITLMLEGLLPKERILTLYLNSVEWGEGVFGAQAAARHYYRSDAARLGPEAAARLAVMLPAPKRFEKMPASPYLASRAAIVQARLGAVVLP